MLVHYVIQPKCFLSHCSKHNYTVYWIALYFSWSNDQLLRDMLRLKLTYQGTTHCMYMYLYHRFVAKHNIWPCMIIQGCPVTQGLSKVNLPCIFYWQCYWHHYMLLAYIIELWKYVWWVWRALKKLELLLAATRHLTPRWCSPNALQEL